MCFRAMRDKNARLCGLRPHILPTTYDRVPPNTAPTSERPHGSGSCDSLYGWMEPCGGHTTCTPKAHRMVRAGEPAGRMAHTRRTHLRRTTPRRHSSRHCMQATTHCRHRPHDHRAQHCSSTLVPLRHTPSQASGYTHHAHRTPQIAPTTIQGTRQHKEGTTKQPLRPGSQGAPQRGWRKAAMQGKIPDMQELVHDDVSKTTSREDIARHATTYYVLKPVRGGGRGRGCVRRAVHEAHDRPDRLRHRRLRGAKVHAATLEAHKRRTCPGSDRLIAEMWQAATNTSERWAPAIAWALNLRLQSKPERHHAQTRAAHAACTHHHDQTMRARQKA